jgi:hypothetical protein
MARRMDSNSRAIQSLIADGLTPLSGHSPPAAEGPMAVPRYLGRPAQLAMGALGTYMTRVI